MPRDGFFFIWVAETFHAPRGAQTTPLNRKRQKTWPSVRRSLSNTVQHNRLPSNSQGGIDHDANDGNEDDYDVKRPTNNCCRQLLSPVAKIAAPTMMLTAFGVGAQHSNPPSPTHHNPQKQTPPTRQHQTRPSK